MGPMQIMYDVMGSLKVKDGDYLPEVDMDKLTSICLPGDKIATQFQRLTRDIWN